MNAGTLATVPDAGHAARADAAGHASSADTAHSADLLGGKGPDAFMSAGRIQVGSGDSMSKTPITLLSWPDLGLSVETDGDPDFDSGVVVRNASAATLSFVSPYGVFNLFAGKTITPSGGAKVVETFCRGVRS